MACQYSFSYIMRPISKRGRAYTVQTYSWIKPLDGPLSHDSHPQKDSWYILVLLYGVGLLSR